MAKRGPKTEQQFRYWHIRRRGASQADIAREHGITRQAVNKSIQLLEREVVFRLLDTAQTSGVLVEWYDARLGVLIGITPQLGNLPCLLLIDDTNRVRLVFDQVDNPDPSAREVVMSELHVVLKRTLGLDIAAEVDFKQMVNRITELAKR